MLNLFASITKLTSSVSLEKLFIVSCKYLENVFFSSKVSTLNLKFQSPNNKPCTNIEFISAYIGGESGL